MTARGYHDTEVGETVPTYCGARLPDLHVEGTETLARLLDTLVRDEAEETRARLPQGGPAPRAT